MNTAATSRTSAAGAERFSVAARRASLSLNGALSSGYVQQISHVSPMKLMVPPQSTRTPPQLPQIIVKASPASSSRKSNFSDAASSSTTYDDYGFNSDSESLPKPPTIITTKYVGGVRQTRKRAAPVSSPSSTERKAKYQAFDDDFEPGEGGLRQDSSLLRLTRKFLDLRPENEDSPIVNLNEASTLLGVQKRRLYDITNVLEGISVIEKIGKNSVRFKTSADLAQAKDTQNLRDEVADLCQQENYLDALLRSTTSAMNLTREDPTDVPYQYLTYNDLHALEDLQRKMLIALKSPTGSRCCLQTPINNEIGYQLFVKSESGDALQAFICPSDSANLKEWKPEPTSSASQMTNSFNSSTDSTDLIPHDLKGDLQTINFVQPDVPLTRLMTDAKLTPNSFKAFVSPLKLVADGGPPLTPAKSSNDLHHLAMSCGGDVPTSSDASLAGFISLDPVREPEPFGYAMSEQDTLHSLFTNDDW